MFNFKKVRKLGVKKNEEGKEDKYEADRKGMDEKQQEDQEKYEEKVNGLLKCCKKFNNALIKNSKGKTLTGESIKKTFEDIVGSYFEASNKLSMFSHAKRVYQGMLKELKKHKKVELNNEENAELISGAFSYKKSKTKAKEGYTSRSVVDDKAVYVFFNVTLPKTMLSIVVTADKAKLKKIKGIMNFIAKVQDDMKDMNEQIEDLEEKTQESEKQIVDINKWTKKVKGHVTTTVKKMLSKVTIGLKGSKKQNDENSKKIEELKNQLSEIDGTFLEFTDELNSGEKVSEERMNFIVSEGKKLEDKKKEIRKELKKLGVIIHEVDEEVEGLEVQVEEAGNPPETSFKIENHKLIIHSTKAFKEFRDNLTDYLGYQMSNEVSDKTIESLDLSGVSDISAANGDNNGTFYNFSHLKTVKTSNLTKLGDCSVFGYCKNLTEFNMKGNYGYNIEGIDTIGKHTFWYCGKKSGFKANVSAKTIGESAFQSSGLTEINLPNATTIEGSAFYGCKGLTKITLGQEEVKITWGAIPNDAKVTVVLACTNEEKRKNLAGQIRDLFSNVKIKDSSGNELLPPKAEANQPEQQAATENTSK